MAYGYALVHLKFTIPLAAALTAAAYPILNRAHVFQISLLAAVAFFATLPWDAYLIRQKVWTYPPDAVLGFGLSGIPVEELFFFVIQTYITSLIYILANKPVLHVRYLGAQCRWEKNSPSASPPHSQWPQARHIKRGGQLFLAGLTLYGAHLVQLGGPGTYLGLILIWAPPFALLTWSVAGLFIINLPWFATWIPVILPTVYLWLVDERALHRGTWSIESGTKLNMRLFGSLEIEEAIFFLATNVLVVFGLAAFDQYLAVIHAFPDLFPDVPQSPTPLLLFQPRLVDSSRYDFARIAGIQEAATRLQRKSRSFYLASAAFSGRLRIDLILLYSFCRMADDLVDNAKSENEVMTAVQRLTTLLDLYYPNKHDAAVGRGRSTPEGEAVQHKIKALIHDEFPAPARSALSLLPVQHLPPKPLYGLLEGFKTDARFMDGRTFPIADEEQLLRYASCVAGTVGELCVALIAHHCDVPDGPYLSRLRSAARQMGTALQYVNMARDIATDAHMGRVYLPTTWLREEDLTPEAVVQQPTGAAVERLRRMLLDKAFEMYREARPAMMCLPPGARRPMMVAVESYMEIGRVLREQDSWTVEDGKATVPPVRRARTALRALVREQ